MSNANSTEKVLRTALKRVQKRWGQKSWGKMVPDGKGGQVQMVCMEGAVTGGCNLATTDQQKEALELMKEAANQLFGDIMFPTADMDIKFGLPAFNDLPEFTKEHAEQVVKLALIKSELGNLEEEEIAEEVETLVKEW